MKGHPPSPLIAARDREIAEKRAAGATLRELSEAYGITKSRVHQVADNHEIVSVRARERQRIIEMCDAGMTAQQIAAELGTDVGNIHRRIKTSGAKVNKPERKPRPPRVYKSYYVRKHPVLPAWDRLAKNIDFAPGRCWAWTGNLNKYGYGETTFRLKGRSRLAHRLVYEELVGEIPRPLVIDHLCRTTWCVHPGHMDITDIGENSRRGVHPPGQGRKRKVPLCPMS